LASYLSSNDTTYFFTVNGKWTWGDYKTWTYTYDSSLSLQWKKLEAFPFDSFESQIIYVWTSDAIYPEIKLEAPVVKGFVVTLRPIGPVDPGTVFSSMSLGERMFIGISPNAEPYGFQIIVQRDPSSIFLYSLYFFTIFFLVYFIGAFSYLSGIDVEKRIGLLATLSISVVAFAWTLRQIAGSITYIEGILMIEIFGFIVHEIVRNTDLSSPKDLLVRIVKKLRTFISRFRRKRE
jgi:multisubunit Na+/H+ antiporter MnhF subunit